MKIEKIDVQPSSIKNKTDISLLVDKHDFLEEIQRLREKWQLKKPTKETHHNGVLRIITDESLLSYSRIDVNVLEKKLSEFKKDIDNLLKNSARGKNFRIIVLFALFIGSIPDGVYKSCYFDVVTINEAEDLNKPENYQYVIVLSPRTEQQDVVEAFHDFVKHRDGKIKFQQPRISMDSPETSDVSDAMECIKREQKICDEKINKEPKNSEVINKAISEYLEKTEKARNYMLSIGELDIHISEHQALIEKYRPGSIYNTADTAKFRGKNDIDRIREWYWIRNEKYFNGEAPKPLPYPEVLAEWLNSCPVYKAAKTHDLDEPVCPKCTFESTMIRKDKRVKDGGGSFNHIEKALNTYSNLLRNS